MMVAVSSIDALAGARLQWQPDAIVSIHRPTLRMPPIADVRHLRLAFHDVERSNGRAHPCRLDHVNAFLAFILKAVPDRLLIHCTAGLSRSPAFAIIARCQAGATAEAACTEVLAAVPHASPNRWVLKLGDHALGTGGGIVRAASSAFTYRRTAFGAVGSRSGFVVLK